MSCDGKSGQRPILREGDIPKITPPDPSSIHIRQEVERWFLELRSPVLGYLRSLGCRPSIAEEMTQEVFLRLHRALRDKLQVIDVRAWVFRVARNLLIDSRREDRRYGQTQKDGLGFLDLVKSDAAPDPEQQLLQRERIRIIAEDVRRLPALQRECLHLKAQGLRYHEIAVVLGIPMTTAVHCVRQAVKRAGRRFNEGT